MVIPFPGINPVLSFPGYVTGRYYAGILTGGGATLVVAANVVYFIPYTVFQNHTFTAIAPDVAAIGTANNARMAIYSSIAGQPGSLILDAGLATGANPMQTTGMKPSANISLSLAPGTYWTCSVFDGIATMQGIPAAQIGLYTQMGVGPANDFVNPDSQVTATMAFGAFPAVAFSGAMGALTYTALPSIFTGLRA